VTDWGAFAGLAGVVVLLLLLLARASQSAVSPSGPSAGDRERRPDGAVDADAEPWQAPGTGRSRGSAATSGVEAGAVDDETAGVDSPSPGTTGERETDAGVATGRRPAERGPAERNSTERGTTERNSTEQGIAEHHPTESGTTERNSTERGPGETRAFGTGELLANVLVTHGLFAGVIVAAAVYWQVPAAALGVAVPTPATVGWGVALGVGLYVADELGAAAAERLGAGHEETLRGLLAPDSAGGWVLLLVGVLPVIAAAEELVFRGVLVGALAAGFGLPAWGLAVVSSVAFALGHGAQGFGGVLVTGLLGFVLAAAFVLTGSLALVIVAHYVVNALEFVVHEGLGRSVLAAPDH